MTTKQALLIGVAFVGVAGASASWAAPATEGGPTVEEVIVTAQRVEQNLQKVPVAVTAIGGEELEARKLNDFSQLQLVSPSFQTTTDNAFSLRGIGSNIFLPTVDSSVGVMVDDVSLGVPLFQSNGVFNDVARVEVLRGPQGLLFGRNASAGLLNVVTNRPRLGETSGTVGGEYDNRDTAAGGNRGIVLRGTLNMPLTETSALRVNVLASSQDPIAKATVTSPPGAQVDQTQERIAARVKYLWEPTDATSIYATADYSRERGVGGIWDRTLRTVGAGVYSGSLASIGATAGPRNLQYGIDSASGDYRSVDTYGVSLNVSHKLSPNLTISNILAWRRYDLQLNLDTDYSTLDLFNTNTNGSNNRQLSEELRLAFDFDRVDGQVGLYYFGSVNNGHTQLYANFGSGIPNFYGGDFSTRNTTASTAAFGQVNFHVTDDLTLLAGGRLTYDKVKVDIAQDFGTYVNGPGLYGPQGNFKFSESNTNFSYKIGAQYQFTPDVMAYLTYATGYKGPAYPQNLGSTAFDPYIAPETVEDLEAGLRSTLFDGRLRFNVSGFYEEFSDFQTQTYDPVAALFRLTNAGGVRAKGIEIDGAARPTEQLTINFGASFTDSEFTDFITTCYPGQTVAQGCVAGQFQAKGLAPAGAPKFTSTLQAIYEIPVGDNLLSLEANWFRRSSVNFSPNGDPGTALGGVDVFGASLTYRFGDRYKASLFCKNCTDEYVPSFLSHITADPTAILQSWNYNSVRTIGVSFDIDF
ncbi:MAG: TonB-dependent receptor [Caulobacter sp.]|nr:TonB-dependent receptor [Caulobacter sp.]